MMGCGKSHYASITGLLVINQDSLKTRQKCLKMFQESLINNEPSIVDNTNPSPSVRKMYIDLAKKYNKTIKCLHFTASPEICRHNDNYRDCIGNVPRLPDIAFNIFKKNYQVPTLEEGFKEIIEIPFLLDMSIID